MINDLAQPITHHDLRGLLAEHPRWLVPLTMLAEQRGATMLDVQRFARVLADLDASPAATATTKVNDALALWRTLAQHTGWTWMHPVLIGYVSGDLPNAEQMRSLDVGELFTAGQLFKMPRRAEEAASEHRARMRAEAARREVDAALREDIDKGSPKRSRVIRAVAEAGPLTRTQATFLLEILRWANEATVDDSPMSLLSGLWAQVERVLPFPTADDLSLATFALFTLAEVRRG